jgi:hypothetical protein
MGHRLLLASVLSRTHDAMVVLSVSLPTVWFVLDSVKILWQPKSRRPGDSA